MNTKNILGAALVAAVTTAAIAPIATAATLQVVPAAYAEGTVTAIDTKANTIVVAGQTYTFGAAAHLTDVTTGSNVDVAYVMQNGKRVILAVTPTETEADELAE